LIPKNITIDRMAGPQPRNEEKKRKEKKRKEEDKLIESKKILLF